MSGDLDLKRFDVKAGYRLVDYRTVGLPVYNVQLDVLSEERRELPLIGEYVLRLIAAGISEIEQLVQMLGLTRPVVQGALADLLRQGSATGDECNLAVTAPGREILDDYGDMVCTEATWYVVYDAILGRPHPWRFEQLRTPYQMSEALRMEISPFGERPSMRDFSINAVTQALSTLRPGRDLERLVAIRGVRKCALRYVYAIALAFRGTGASGDQAHVEFIVDGRPMPDHDEAFANRDGMQRPLFRSIARDDVEDKEARKAARRRLLRSRSQTVDGAALPPQKGQLTLTDPEMPSSDIRDVPIFRLREVWTEALAGARSELIITSRALQKAFLEREVLPSFKELLKRGVKLYIGIGPDAQFMPADNTDLHPAIQVLVDLKRDFSDLLVVQTMEKCDTSHIILDGRLLVVSDYDWLTVDGGRTRHLRSRWALESDNDAIIAKERNRLLTSLLNSA